jgi:hypothetical protein
MWLNDNEGSDLNHAGRVRVAKKVNAMVKAEVMKETRRCARICEDMAKDSDAMNGGHHHVAGTAIAVRRIILDRETYSIAGVRLNGRAAMTPKTKAGGTQKRRAAKRDKGTAKGRAVAGSSPAPGFSAAQEARAMFADRCARIKLRNTRYF